MLHSFCARFTWPRRVIGKWRAKLIHSWIQRHQGAFTHKTKKCKYHRSIAKCKYITPCLSKSWASSHFWRTGFNLSCNFLLASRIASMAWRSCPSENVPHRSLEKNLFREPPLEQSCDDPSRQLAPSPVVWEGHQIPRIPRVISNLPCLSDGTMEHDQSLLMLQSYRHDARGKGSRKDHTCLCWWII